MPKPVALLDVDHTLLFGDDELNIALLDSLMARGIRDVYLFTDMTVNSSGLHDRQRLIQRLKERGFEVHGVITPLDLLWQKIPADQAKEFMDYINQTNLKFSGPEFEELLNSDEILRKFPVLSERTKTDLKEVKLGVAYEESVKRLDEVTEGQSMPDNLNSRGNLAKILADQWALNRGYSHTKGLLLEAFLQNKPEWVSSVVVADDNDHVIESVGRVKEQKLNGETQVTPILISKLKEENQVYLEQLRRHMAHDPNPRPPEVFLFDRDSTLIDKREQLFNEEPMLGYLSYLTQNKVPMGIVSSGSIELNEDAAVKAMKRHGLDLDNKHIAYPAMSRSYVNLILNNKPRNLTGVTRVNGGNPPDFPIFNLIAQGELDKSVTPMRVKMKTSNIDSAIEVTPEATFDITLGNATITLNVLDFIGSLEQLSQSDCKIYQTIMALDQLGYQLEVNESLRKLGIVSIQSANPSAKPISANEVVFMDDKPGVFHVMQQAGFRSILATTSEAVKSEEHQERYDQHLELYPDDDISENSYLPKLQDEIKLHNQANPTLKKQQGLLFVEGFIDDKNPAQSLKEILHLSDAVMKKTVFVFPGNPSHHKPETTLYSIKSGSQLAKIASGLGSDGYPVLSLPTSGMEQWKDNYTQQAMVQNALCDLWRAVGAGYTIALPVREQKNKDYFEDSIEIMGRKMEPSFWDGVLKNANPELAAHYLKQIQLLQKVCEMTNKERKQFFEEQKNEALKHPNWSPEFEQAYYGGVARSEQDAWYHERPNYNLHSTLYEIRLKEGKLRDEQKKCPENSRNWELLEDKINALKEVRERINAEHMQLYKKEGAYQDTTNPHRIFQEKALQIVSDVQTKHKTISEHRDMLSYIFSKLLNAVNSVFSNEPIFKTETATLFSSLKEKARSETPDSESPKLH